MPDTGPGLQRWLLPQCSTHLAAPQFKGRAGRRLGQTAEIGRARIWAVPGSGACQDLGRARSGVPRSGACQDLGRACDRRCQCHRVQAQRMVAGPARLGASVR